MCMRLSACLKSDYSKKVILYLILYGCFNLIDHAVVLHHLGLLDLGPMSNLLFVPCHSNSLTLSWLMAFINDQYLSNGMCNRMNNQVIKSWRMFDYRTQVFPVLGCLVMGSTQYLEQMKFSLGSRNQDH